MPHTAEELTSMFEEFIVQYKKVYTSEEDKSAHFHTYCENIEKIDAHNSTPGMTWTMGVNQFTDMTPEEMRAKGYIGGILPEGCCGKGEGCCGKGAGSCGCK